MDFSAGSGSLSVYKRVPRRKRLNFPLMKTRMGLADPGRNSVLISLFLLQLWNGRGKQIHLRVHGKRNDILAVSGWVLLCKTAS